MAIVCTDASGSNLSRATGSFLNYNTAYTAMCWVLYTVTPGAGGSIMWQIDDAVSVFDSMRIINDGANDLLRLWNNGSQINGTTHLAQSTWYHCTLVRSAANASAVYLNGGLEASDSFNMTGRAAAARELHGSSLTGRLAALKVWSGVALTISEIQNEMRLLPPRTALSNLYLWLPEWPGSGERTRDYSGNGRTYAENGTVTDGDPPPVSYGLPVRLFLAPDTRPPPPTRSIWHPRGPVYAPARIY